MKMDFSKHPFPPACLTHPVRFPSSAWLTSGLTIIINRAHSLIISSHISPVKYLRSVYYYLLLLLLLPLFLLPYYLLRQSSIPSFTSAVRYLPTWLSNWHRLANSARSEIKASLRHLVKAGLLFSLFIPVGLISHQSQPFYERLCPGVVGVRYVWPVQPLRVRI